MSSVLRTGALLCFIFSFANVMVEGVGVTFTKLLGTAGKATLGVDNAVDSNGNIFVTGMQCTGTNDHDCTSGTEDLFLTKYGRKSHLA
jgi:hypothetical protein